MKFFKSLITRINRTFLPPITVTPAPVPAPEPTPEPAPTTPPAPDPVPTVPQPQPVPQYRGCNLTGGDCYWLQIPASGPVSGSNYLFVTEADVDYLVSKGMTAFRLLFGWEAIQPTPYRTLGGTDNAGKYFANFKRIVDYITNTKGCVCLIDIHGGKEDTFAAYYGKRIGIDTYTTNGATHKVSDLFENLWWQLGGIFKNNPRVWYGLTNEPHDMPATTWFAAAQQAIEGIRRAGATGKIVAPGVDWTNASNWTKQSAGAFSMLKDPANNLAIQVHMYFDANAGGGANDIVDVDIGVTRLRNTVDWAKANGVQVVLAEVGLSANNALAAEAWRRTLAYIDANRDTVLGFMWWAYGPPAWWSGYRFTLCKLSNTDSPQMDLIEGAFK